MFGTETKTGVTKNGLAGGARFERSQTGSGVSLIRSNNGQTRLGQRGNMPIG